MPPVVTNLFSNHHMQKEYITSSFPWHGFFTVLTGYNSKLNTNGYSIYYIANNLLLFQCQTPSLQMLQCYIYPINPSTGAKEPLTREEKKAAETSYYSGKEAFKLFSFGLFLLFLFFFPLSL